MALGTEQRCNEITVGLTCKRMDIYWIEELNPLDDDRIAGDRIKADPWLGLRTFFMRIIWQTGYGQVTLVAFADRIVAWQ